MAPRHPRLHPWRPALRRAGVACTPLLILVAAVVVLPSTATAGWRVEALSSEAVAPSSGPTHRSLVDAAREAEEQAGADYSAGRYGEALSAQLHSVQMHRTLASQDPSQRLQLAASLHNLGVVLIRLGRKSEAIPPTEESLALYRSAAGAHREKAYGGGGPVPMERPLRNLVLLYFEGNRPQEALPLADELVRLHQRSGGDDPMALAERVDVMNLRASLLVVLNRPQEALQDLEAAVALGRQLTQRIPGNSGLQYSLAGSLVNLSQVADLLGRPDQALQPAHEAEALLRQVARANPRMLGDWAKSLSRLGQAHARLGHLSSAEAPLQESIALLRLLTRSAPSESLVVEVGGYRDDLAHALEILAEVQQRLHRAQAARSAAAEAMVIYRSLAQTDPRYAKDVERTRSWLTSQPQATPIRR